ncbi:pectate lyase superfamily protein [Burkholderia sp. MSHR3999]|uniref:glycosyl hydrolase family 28-related protein n=1 Tax=Burkholderia sp. MSHR3999 TaxID=1542965 RepID=UPI0005B6F2EC|nr:glycosyl hydrolase family 28-related protein [Burkholderia sp. MSHR3999]KIP18870.1 pectate lyase superfamily protein [Burkholderia sp. MSHR3999]
MQRIDSLDGRFHDGDPTKGLLGTFVMAAWLNALQEEVASVVESTGVALDPTRYTQLRDAIHALNVRRSILTDSGVKNAYAASNPTPLTADTLVHGVRQLVQIENGNDGPSTYAPDGLPPKPIYSMNHLLLQGGELVSPGVADLTYIVHAAFNQGNGAWLLDDCSGGGRQTAPATHSGHAVPLGQLTDSSKATPGAALIGWDGGTLATQIQRRISYVADSVAEVSGLDVAKYTRAFATGFSAIGDGGGGPYQYLSTSTATVDGATVLAAAGGVGRWHLQITGPISVKQFGAKGDGVHDDTVAVRAWIAFVLATGVEAYAPAGTYLITQQIVMDWGVAWKPGAKFRGAGINRSVFDLSSVIASPAWLMTDSTGQKAAFHGGFSDIGIKATCSGPALQVGLEDGSDAFNEFEIKVSVSNLNPTSNACAIELNGVYNSDLFLVGNNAGRGDALRLRYLQFSRMFGSFGNAETAMHMTGGYVNGNSFIALDLEVVNNCVVIDAASIARNTWIGGQFVWDNGVGPKGHAIVATNGNTNRFIGCNFASAGSFVDPGSAVGLEVDNTGVGMHTSGGALVSPISGDAALTVDSVAGNMAEFSFRTAGKLRWTLARNSAGETGNNAGSDLILSRYDDNGNVIDNPMWVNRASGIVDTPKLSVQAIALFGGGLINAPTSITGSRGGNTAVASIINLLTKLNLGIDNTTA